MTRKTDASVLAARDAAILRTLRSGRWLRPCEIAAGVSLGINSTLAALLRLEHQGKVRRREQLVPVYRGQARKRRTTKPIIEYQVVVVAKVRWPDWLMSPGAVPQSAA